MRSNFQINIFTSKVHASYSEFPQDSKHVTSFHLRCVELRKIASKKNGVIDFCYILEITFSNGALVWFVAIAF